MQTRRTRLGQLLLAGTGLLACAGTGAQVAGNCLLGDVRLFAGDYAPVGWMLANGQALSITDHNALFSVLGTTWGGDGMTHFNLPHLGSRIPVGTGQGLGLATDVVEGTHRGDEQMWLQHWNLPPHSHAVAAAGGVATSATPAAGMALAAVPEAGAFAAVAPDTRLAPTSVGSAGSTQPFERLPPSLALNYIICVGGTYPTRN